MPAQDPIATLLERLKIDLAGSAGRVNRSIERGDMLRNLVNYGRLSHCADTLRHLGHLVMVDFWETDEGFLKIESITMNDEDVRF